ncbi:MAG: hypothetical protein IPK03_03210 [Bacteroidetes bacterium]|nr:hypothetical protein [Bacteroidota bacterium]
MIVKDALGQTVTTTLFDIAGNAMTQTTMDAGQRWMLNDVTGKPIISWDDMNREFTFEYDVLHRPTIFYQRWGNHLEKYGH